MNPNQSGGTHHTSHLLWKRLPKVLVAVAFPCMGLVLWKNLEFQQTMPGQKSSPSEVEYSKRIPGHRAASDRRAENKRQWDGLRAVIQAAQAISDPMEQLAAMNRLVEEIPNQNIAALLASLSPEDMKTEAARGLFDYWATASPAEAASWARGLDDPETREAFMILAALRWTVSDLGQAAAWARDLPEEEFRLEIMEAVACEAIRSSPLEALRLGAELPDGLKQTELVCRAAAEWAVTDRNSALEWAKQLEDKDLRQQVIGQVMAASANQDPAGAATTALQEMSPGMEQDRALVTIIEHWVQTDPKGVAAWVSRFPEGKLGEDAIENLVNLWANQDLAASGNWLKTLPAGALKDKGILVYSRIFKRSGAP